MQKLKITLLLLIITTITFLSVEATASPKGPDRETYYFGAIGATFGQDVNVLKSFGGGGSWEFGYQFNKTYALLLQSDVYFTIDEGINYFTIPFIVSGKANFYKGAFAKAGVGYSMIVAEEGPHFRRIKGSKAQIYNGVIADVAAGYEFWLSKKIFLSPEIGMAYTRVSGINRIMPQMRIQLGWLFNWK